MNTVIEITDAGLTLDGRTLLAGTRLVVKNNPHPSWLNVGRVAGQVTEKRLEVASPAHTPAVVPDDTTDDLDALRAEYETVTGKKPHHKAKAETLQAAIDEAKDTNDGE